MHTQLRYASLGSGSSGNATVIEARYAHQTTRVLLDCGFSVRDTEMRLQRLGLCGGDIDALFVTHEHEDHIGGAARFVRRFGTPLYMSRGTYYSVEHHSTRSCAKVPVQFCTHLQAIHVGLLQVQPYTVPHDAREPLQFVFEVAGQISAAASDTGLLKPKRLGVLTDAGHVSATMIESLRACHALVIEYNYDRQKMLASSKYPPSLKQRILGKHGHLDNEDAHRLLSELIHPELNSVHAAHLSRETNDPILVEQMLSQLLSPHEIAFAVACQDEGFDWFDV
jgi:phosphoribosyl 1,2-cyclic phosphodiesterase